MDFDELVTNNIGRVVAFVLTPILLPVATAFAAWAQNALGVDLHGDQLTAYVVSIAVGLAAVAATWLKNRGGWEIAQAELIKLHELGSQEIDSLGEPEQPPGLTPPS